MNSECQEESNKAPQREPYVFIPTLTEVIAGRLRLRYSTVCNTYYRDYEDTINPKTKNTKSNWESVTYESTAIQKYRNETHDELYLGCESNHNRACISWKFDFAASGLVVDTIQVNVEAVQMAYNKLELFIEGDNKKESMELKDEINNSKFKELEGSCSLIVRIVLSTSKPGIYSKLFLQSTAARKFDCPLDINIRLKRPLIAAGRSLLLLGLMFSKKQLIDLRKRPWRRRPQHETDKGFLYIHVREAKRLPSRTSGTLPDPQVKCKLVVGDRNLTCKTLRVRKSVNPVWDEQHVIEGISLETVKAAKLEIKVIHDVLSFNKSKRREILGTSAIESCSRSESKSDDEHSTQPLQEPSSKVNHDVSEMSCTKLNDCDRSNNCRKSSFEEDIIDIFMNGSRTESISFHDNFNDSCLNKNISVSLTSLQSAAKSSICEIDEGGKSSWKNQLKWKGFGKVLGIGNNRSSKGNTALKRPSIVLSNSQETIVVLNPENRTEEDLRKLSNETISENGEGVESRSSNNLLQAVNDDDDDNERRSTLTPTGIQNMNGLLEPFAQLQQTAKLASTHWEKLSEHKEEWLYCWHPLTLR